MPTMTLLDELDVLIERGIYSDQEALIEDALRALLRSRPDLRRQVAIELYKRGRISLSRGAEIEGVDIESFKESLREAGIPTVVPPEQSDAQQVDANKQQTVTQFLVKWTGFLKGVAPHEAKLEYLQEKYE